MGWGMGDGDYARIFVAGYPVLVAFFFFLLILTISYLFSCISKIQNIVYRGKGW